VIGVTSGSSPSHSGMAAITAASAGSNGSSTPRTLVVMFVRGQGDGRVRRRSPLSFAADHEPDPVHRLLTEVPQPMRRRRVEPDRVARPELVLLEAELQPQVSGQDVAVLAAG